MNIFILEDDCERIKSFTKNLQDHSIVICNNADLAVSILNMFKFDLIFLDHDLGGQTFVKSYESNTGYQVAKRIVGSENSKTPVVVHSYNACGADNMVEVLKHNNCGRCLRSPFGGERFFDEALGFANMTRCIIS